VNCEQIRVPHSETHTADHFLTNSIFIGSRLTNQVSHESGVRFGFFMLDNLPSVLPVAKIRLSGIIPKSNEFKVRWYIYI
jgi:hypothetical protein